MRDHTTTGLIDIIKIRAMVPISQDTFPKPTILDIATDEIRAVIIPAILATNEEWLLTSSTVAYARSVDIPKNAISGSLRDIQLLKGEALRPTTKLSVEDLYNTDPAQNRVGFIIEDTAIKFYGAEHDSVLLRFYASPGALVTTDSCAQITAVSYDSGQDVTTFTTVANPTDWTTSLYIDFVSNTPFYKSTSVNTNATVDDSTTITVSGDLTATVLVGDWIAPTGTSPIAQIPQEWLPYLAQAVVSVILEAQGDFDAAAKSTARQNALKASLLGTVTPRVRGAAKKIVAVKNRRN
jgi:hypothetical protein